MSNTTQGASAELLPCPFCGGAARIDSNRDWHKLDAEHDEDCILANGDPVTVSPAQPGYLVRIAEEWNHRAAQPAAPVVPEGYVLMPKRLTAENGAKGALSGEFKESVTVTCHECGGSGDDAESDNDAECAECNGDGTLEQAVPVTWDTIKIIYARAVDLLAASPQVEVAQPDRDAFEREAKHQGATNFTLVHPDFPTCNNGWTPATYRDPMTELAWRVWANKRAGVAPVEVAPQAEQVAQLEAQLDKMWKARFFVSQALHNVMVGNQSAWIEWKYGAGAEAAMQWIENGLIGPGLIPNGTEAQPWFDANQDDRYDVPPRPAQSQPAGAARQGGATQPSSSESTATRTAEGADKRDAEGGAA